MLEAYGGRSAAYEAKGEFGRAAADRGMVILMLCVELEIMENQDLEGRDTLMTELAAAHRARAKALRAADRPKAADADIKRADKLEADAKALAAAATKENKEKPAALTLDDLRKKVEALQQDIDQLKSKTRSGQPEANGTTSSLKVAYGTIEFVNVWTETVTIVLDGATYSLAAGRSLVVDNAAGEFTYEVRHIQAPVTRQVRAGEKFAIRIAPR